MLNHHFKKFYLCLSVLLGSLVLTGCGKKGPPNAPEGASQQFPAIYPAEE
jgi:predicted small lipoprotein YifL